MSVKKYIALSSIFLEMLERFLFIMSFVFFRVPTLNSSANTHIVGSQGYFCIKVGFGIYPREASLEGQNEWKTFCSDLNAYLSSFKSKQDRCW